MPEHVPCNLCGTNHARTLFQLRDYRLYVDDLLWNVVRCTECGLGYLNPRPTMDEAARYYPTEYFRHRPSMGSRYMRQASYVPSMPGRLLDVGTAGGEFLVLLRDRGWDVTGIELAAAGNPHGLKIHATSFPDSPPLPIGPFDVITAWAVFEHLHDPLAAFRRVAELLRPGGTFVLQVPNFRSINARLARLEDVPRHLYFFTARTLQLYAQLVGLRLERVHYVTDLHGGSGRGALRHGLTRIAGKSSDDFFSFYRSTRRQRFQRAPLFATAWTLIGGLERVLLPDWLVRALRISGEMVAIMERPS